MHRSIGERFASSRRPGVLAVVFAIATAGSPLIASSARAEAPAVERDLARALLTAGRERRSQGDLAGARDKFRLALQTVRTPIIALELGSTHIELKELVEAQDVLLSVARMPVVGAETERSTAARADAARLAASLETRIPTAVIRLTSVELRETRDVEIDGRTIAHDGLGAPVKLNPGKHLATATIAGRAVREQFELAEGERREVRFQLNPPAPVLRIEPTRKPEPVTKTLPSGSGRRTAGIVVGGVGIVALGLGSYLAIRSLSTYEDARSHCPTGPGSCDPEGERGGVDAHDQAAVATGVLLGGAAFVAAGAVLFLTAPKNRSVRIQAHGAGLRVLGVW